MDIHEKHKQSMHDRHEHALPVLYVADIFFWQYLVIAIILGIIATRYEQFALAGMVFLSIAFAHSYSLQQKKFPVLKIICIMLCMFFAYIYANHRTLYPDATMQNHVETHTDPMQYQNIQGTITHVQGLPDKRLRIFLKNTNIIIDDSKTIPIPGILNITWDKPPPFAMRPITGQTLTVRSRIRPVYGITSPYWNSLNIWNNTWISGVKTPITLSGKSSYFPMIREHLRFAFTQILFANISPISQNEHFLQDTKISNKIFRNTDFQSKAILIALLFGDRFYLSSQTFEAFNSANISHSLALSGQHLALTTLLGGLFIMLFARIRKSTFEHVQKRELILYATIPLSILYLWIGNASPSLMRAFIMLLCGGILWIRAKSITLMDLLFFALLLFCIVSPQYIFNLGVQLSFSSVLSIALFMPFIRKNLYIFQNAYDTCLPYSLHQQNFATPWEKKLYLTRKFVLKHSIHTVRAIGCLASTSLAIQIGTLPFVLIYFGKISIFFLFNVFWLPILAVIVLPFSAFALICTGIPSLTTLFISIASLPNVALLNILQLIQEFSISPYFQGLKSTQFSMLGFTVLLIFSMYCKGRKIRYSPYLNVLLLLACLAFFSGPYERIFPNKQLLHIHVFNVGQGQSILIDTSKTRLLLDVGGANSPRFNVGRDIIAHALTQNHAPTIEYLMASHTDADHINGMIPLLENFQINAFFHAFSTTKQSTTQKDLLATLKNEETPTTKLVRGDRLDLGNNYYLHVLHPPKITENPRLKSSNNRSLITLLTYHKNGIAIFSGDAEKEALYEVMKYIKTQGVQLNADFLILPHHGSKTSYVPTFYEQVSPKIVTVSCGRYNRFKFPAAKILKYFHAQQIEVLQSHAQGHMIFTWEQDQLQNP